MTEMIRLILFLGFLALAGLGLSWLADRPGEIMLTWQGYRIETSVLVGMAAVLAACIVFLVLWSVLRFILRLPSFIALTARARRRNKGYQALTRGMIAAAAGDTRYAGRAAREAEKLIGSDPLTLLLRAQTAQLEGDRALSEKTFAQMMEDPQTRLLGLRGLHAEAIRRGDGDSAHLYAAQAQAITPLGWAGEALLDWHVRRRDWSSALEIVEANRKHKLTLRDAADRQRAVLLTAQARDLADNHPDQALRDAREAVKLAPSLVPANVQAAQLMARRGDLRKASRLLEAAWRIAPHPDLAETYVHLRAGDAAQERYERARHLAALMPQDADGALMLARAAMDARHFEKARAALGPLLARDERPSRRLCLLMADLEHAEHGAQSGPVREWLARAARAPRDAIWIADGMISDRWEPASPVTGKLDAFRWDVPQDVLSAPIEPTALETMPVVETQTAPPQIDAPPPPRAKPLAGQALYPMPSVPDDPGPAGDEKDDTERRFS
jgi:HemY protein